MQFLLFNQSNDLKFDHSYIKKILIHQSWRVYIVYDIVLLDSNRCRCTFDHMVSFLTLRFNDSISFSFLLTEKCAIDSEGAFFWEFLLISLLLWKEGAPPMGSLFELLFSRVSLFQQPKTTPSSTDGRSTFAVSAGPKDAQIKLTDFPSCISFSFWMKSWSLKWNNGWTWWRCHATFCLIIWPRGLSLLRRVGDECCWCLVCWDWEMLELEHMVKLLAGTTQQQC